MSFSKLLSCLLIYDLDVVNSRFCTFNQGLALNCFGKNGINSLENLNKMLYHITPWFENAFRNLRLRMFLCSSSSVVGLWLRRLKQRRTINISYHTNIYDSFLIPFVNNKKNPPPQLHLIINNLFIDPQLSKIYDDDLHTFSQHLCVFMCVCVCVFAPD